MIAVKVIPSHSVSYTDREGNEQTKVFRTVLPASDANRMKIHPGGSVFLGKLTVITETETPHGKIVEIRAGLTARIRVDGEVVLEPTLRQDDWFDSDNVSHPGGMVFDFIGDESRIAFAALACKGIPALAKRVKSARAALGKRAA